MAKQRPVGLMLGIDWETSGATWGGDSSIDYQGIAAGVLVIDTGTLEVRERLKFYVKFDSTKYKWSTDAEKIHGISIDFLNKHGISQEDAAIQLIELILRHWGPDEKVMLVGHNAQFDRSFTDQLLKTVDFEFSDCKTRPNNTLIQLHHVFIDTAAIGFIAFGLYKSDLLFERVGFGERSAHDPLQDIEYTLGVLQAVRSLVQLGENSL